MVDDTVLKLWEQIKHFSPQEFDDPTAPGSGYGMNIEFVKLLDTLRDRVGIPLHLNSGFRTVEHNNAVGGKPDSAHLKGVASDIAVNDGQLRFSLIKGALDLGFKRVGIGDTFVHLDMDLNVGMPQNVVWLYPPGKGG